MFVDQNNNKKTNIKAHIKILFRTGNRTLDL